MSAPFEHIARRSVAVIAALVIAWLIMGGAPAAAFCAEDEATPNIEAVEVSAEGSTARMADVDFGIADFSRVEKGSNRAIDGVYRGYSYLMDTPANSVCLVDMAAFVVVYVPAPMVHEYELDLEDSMTQRDLAALLSALDANSASGNATVKDSVPWYFTSEQVFTHAGIEFAFSQEYQPGSWYTSVRGTDGSDVTDSANPVAQSIDGLRLSHVDYANIQRSDALTMVATPSSSEQAGSFFATLDWSPLWVTLKTTGTALVFIFALGLLAAWWTMRLKPRTQSVIDAILTIPMVLPPTVCGFLLLLCLGRNTPVGAWFDSVGFPLVFSWQATVIAAFVVAFPLMYRSARGAFEAIDTDMLDAARTLGWGEARIFFQLMLPLAWSSIAAGTMLAFARALGEFGATLFLAGNYVGITRTIPIAIYFEWMGGNIEAALFWTIVVIVISFAVICALNVWSRRTTKYRLKEVAQ